MVIVRRCAVTVARNSGVSFIAVNAARFIVLSDAINGADCTLNALDDATRTGWNSRAAFRWAATAFFKRRTDSTYSGSAGSTGAGSADEI